MVNSYEASQLLSLADSMLSHTMEPVSWILYRPPWSDEICCKHLVYEHVKRKSLDEVYFHEMMRHFGKFTLF